MSKKPASVFFARAAALSAVLLAGILAPRAAAQQIPSGDIRIHYHRPDLTYTGWTVYAFGDTTEVNNYNSGPVQVSGSDGFGSYFDVGVAAAAQNVGLIIHNPTAPGGDVKDPGPNEFVDPSTQGNEYWAISGDGALYTSVPDLTQQPPSFCPAMPASIISGPMATIPTGPCTPSTIRLSPRTVSTKGPCRSPAPTPMERFSTCS